MKTLLINPQKTRRPSSGYISPLVDAGLPLACLHLAAYLEKNNEKVEILDCLANKDSVKQQISKEIIKYGLTDEKFIEKIQQINPDIIGISSQFTAQIDNVLYLAKLIKKINPKLPVIAGGPAISTDTINILKKETSIDIGIIGEGELTLLELVQHFKGKRKLEDIKGIVYREKNKLIQSPSRLWIKNLDELPLPAYHLIDMEFYLNLPKLGIHNRLRDNLRTVSLITSRGCPMNCVFCAVHLVSGKVWRGYSSNYVVKHIKFLIEKYKVEQIHIEDDNFTLDMKRVNNILDGILKNNLKFIWDTPNGVRADKLNQELIQKMKKTGCVKLTVAPESGSQEVLNKIIDKKLNLNKVIEIAEICKKEKIPLIAFFVIGFPGETKKDIQQTVDFAKMLMKKYNVIVGGAMHATPFYGTRLYHIAKENNHLIKEVTPETLGTSLTGESLIKTPDFTPEDLKEFNKQLIRASFKYSALRYIKHPVKLIKRFSNPFLIKVTLERFIKGADV